MKKSLTVLFVALFVLSCVSVFAGEAHKAGKAHASHVMGEVISVDSATSTFVVRETLKDKSTKEITITTEPGTKIQQAGKMVTLTDLAAGDTVTVSYNPTADGKNMAHTVSISKPKTAEPPSKS